mmetsp:Transcript_52170/g.136387  ORF Transcript_52170/g.136387 Transcript_52170/m.136387 type:complete len:238 (-) Transcript_52170:427-1140(-)
MPSTAPPQNSPKHNLTKQQKIQRIQPPTSHKPRTWSVAATSASSSSKASTFPWSAVSNSAVLICSNSVFLLCSNSAFLLCSPLVTNFITPLFLTNKHSVTEPRHRHKHAPQCNPGHVRPRRQQQTHDINHATTSGGQHQSRRPILQRLKLHETNPPGIRIPRQLLQESRHLLANWRWRPSGPSNHLAAPLILTNCPKETFLPLPQQLVHPPSWVSSPSRMTPPSSAQSLCISTSFES